MLPVLALALFIAYMHKRTFLEKAGFDKPIVGMVLVGSMVGLIADIPLIVSQGSLLNINLGGALIPIIVSGTLIYKKKMEYIGVVVGIGAVSAVAYYVTSFEPSLGIIAEFPEFLYPSLLAIPLALVFERDAFSRIPYAYTVAVMGNLIGADIVRIPMLIDVGIFGSIGGAGAMDLVYLSGLIASIPVITYYYFKYPYSYAKEPLDESLKDLRKGEVKRSFQHSVIAVKKIIHDAKRLIYRRSTNIDRQFSSDVDVLRTLGLHPYVIRDYMKLSKGNPRPTLQEAHKGFFTSRLLINSIKDKLKDNYNSLGARIAAYIIDVIIITLPLILLLLYLYFRIDVLMEPFYSSSLFLAILTLLISIQFIYFTLVEWYFGTSIGKRVMGLWVVSDDFSDITFTQSAARNSARYADILLFFYIISLILIVSGNENKRIGDYVADTRVVKIK